MPASQSQLELRGFSVRSFELASNANYQHESPSIGTLSVDYEVFVNEDDLLEFQLVMPVKIADRTTLHETNEPYALQVSAVGLFRFAAGTDDDLIARMVHLNAPAMLYGLVRGYVAQTTANAENGTYLLPVFNFVQLRKSKLVPPKSQAEPLLDAPTASE